VYVQISWASFYTSVGLSLSTTQSRSL